MNNLESLQKLMEETMKQLQSYMDLIKELQEENLNNKNHYEYNMKIKDSKINELETNNEQLKKYVYSDDGMSKLYSVNIDLKEENKKIMEQKETERKRNEAYLLEIYDKDEMLKQKDEKISGLNEQIKSIVKEG